MAFIRIQSDGTTHGTKVFNRDGSEITGITKLEIMPLEAGRNDSVRARLTLDFVEMDVSAEQDMETMPVSINGKVEQRAVAGTERIYMTDGSEVECIRRPELFHGEFASYTLDGRVTIHRGPQDE